MSPLTLTTADGVRLAARWRPAQADGVAARSRGNGEHPAGRVAVVVVHGFCGSKDEPSVELVARHQSAVGRGVITFDLRGHGQSGGATTLGLLERLDIDAAVRAARVDADIVVVVGASMGGVASIEHLAAASASGRGVDGTAAVGTDDGTAATADGGVVVATPARWQVPRSARGVMALMLTRTPPGRAVTARRMGTRVAIRPDRGPEPRVRIVAVRRPIAIIHGLADRFVSPVAARVLYAAAAEPRRLDLVPGMGHGFCDVAVAPVDAAISWALEHIDDGRHDRVADPRDHGCTTTSCATTGCTTTSCATTGCTTTIGRPSRPCPGSRCERANHDLRASLGPRGGAVSVPDDVPATPFGPRWVERSAGRPQQHGPARAPGPPPVPRPNPTPPPAGASPATAGTGGTGANGTNGTTSTADDTTGSRDRSGHGPLRDLLIGQSVSSLGDWMGTVALMALVLELTDSATAVGGVLVLRLAPTVFAGPVAARLVTRWSRRKIMLAMDAVRIPAVAVLPWITELWWIYLWAFVTELAGMVFLPARDASIPDLVDNDDDLAVANGLVLGSSYGMIPIGAGLFAVISAVAGSDGVAIARLVFAVDAATFLLSFLAIARLPELGTHRGSAAGDEGRFIDALRLPLVRRLAPVAAGVAFGLGALFSIGIVWVQEVLDATDTQFGLLVACFGVGAGAGLLTLRQLDRRDLATVRVALIIQGAVVATMSLAPTITFALLGAVGFGALTAFVLALAMELLQAGMGDRDRVLAFTVFHVVIRGGLALAAMGAGVAADVLDEVHWPLLGHLASSQVVLLSSGALVAAVALFAGRPGGAADATR